MNACNAKRAMSQFGETFNFGKLDKLYKLDQLYKLDKLGSEGDEKRNVGGRSTMKCLFWHGTGCKALRPNNDWSILKYLTHLK